MDSFKKYLIFGFLMALLIAFGQNCSSVLSGKHDDTSMQDVSEETSSLSTSKDRAFWIKYISKTETPGVYVAYDQILGQINELIPSTGSIKTISSFERGSGPPLSWPMAIAVSPNGNKIAVLGLGIRESGSSIVAKHDLYIIDRKSGDRLLVENLTWDIENSPVRIDYLDEDTLVFANAGPNLSDTQISINLWEYHFSTKQLVSISEIIYTGEQGAYINRLVDFFITNSIYQFDFLQRNVTEEIYDRITYDFNSNQFSFQKNVTRSIEEFNDYQLPNSQNIGQGPNFGYPRDFFYSTKLNKIYATVSTHLDGALAEIDITTGDRNFFLGSVRSNGLYIDEDQKIIYTARPIIETVNSVSTITNCEIFKTDIDTGVTIKIGQHTLSAGKVACAIASGQKNQGSFFYLVYNDSIPKGVNEYYYPALSFVLVDGSTGNSQLILGSSKLMNLGAGRIVKIDHAKKIMWMERHTDDKLIGYNWQTDQVIKVFAANFNIYCSVYVLDKDYCYGVQDSLTPSSPRLKRISLSEVPSSVTQISSLGWEDNLLGTGPVLGSYSYGARLTAISEDEKLAFVTSGGSSYGGLISVEIATGNRKFHSYPVRDFNKSLQGY